MERIFGDSTDYSVETPDQLKQVMLLSEQNRADVSSYGKTGISIRRYLLPAIFAGTSVPVLRRPDIFSK